MHSAPGEEGMAALNIPVRPRTLVSVRTVAHVALRIGAGLLFMEHGLQKLFGWLGGQTVPLATQLGVAGVLELFGGLMIVLGVLTRPVALVLTAEMIVAYSLAHAGRAVWPVQNGGELALLYALIFAYLAANGPGAFSVDRVVDERLI
jgi:putative oxidoreductase